MGWFSSKDEKSTDTVSWQNLTTLEQWKSLQSDSSETNHVVFKHSTRCSISIMAKRRFEKDWSPKENTILWYLDLLEYRNISNTIAEDTNIMHQSPQAILMRNGQIIYHETHGNIDAKEIIEKL